MAAEAVAVTFAYLVVNGGKIGKETFTDKEDVPEPFVNKDTVGAFTFSFTLSFRKEDSLWPL